MMVAAAFQGVISFVPTWSAHFGAPERLLRSPPMLATAGIGVAGVLLLCSVYAASGAGYIRPLPARRFALLGVGSVFTARGLVLVPLVLEGFNERAAAESISSSIFALVVGTMLLAGTIARWKELK